MRCLYALALLVLLFCFTITISCGEGQEDDDDDQGSECETWRDCPGELICKEGWCVEPAFPIMNEWATRRVTADDPEENVIVNGRLIRPAARATALGTFPTRMALSPDGSFLAVNENGFGTVIDPENWRDKRHVLRVVDAASMEIVSETIMPNGSMYIGLRFNPTGTRLYASGGEDGQIHVYDVSGNTLSLNRSIPVEECYTGDIVLTYDESTLYVSCDLENTVAVVDLADNTVKGRYYAGARPYALYLSPDGKRLFVSNWAKQSLYASSDGSPDKGGEKTYPRPPDTVSVLEAATGKTITRIQVGLAPEGLTPSPDGSTLYAVCNKNDAVYEIDVAGLFVKRILSLHEDPGEVKGVGPITAAVSPDGGTLYVTGAGENFIAVVDLAAGRVLGRIPTEWYPTDAALSPDGRTLYVLNGKGKGDGPTDYIGDGTESRNRGQVGRQLFGSIFRIPVPDAQTLADYTATVQENNQRQQTYFDFSEGNDTALPSPGEDRGSPIKYVFMILKENFSYDAAYGEMEIGEGEPEYNLWSEEVIPNQRKLAREFVLFDNFYCDSESSIDGHQWAAAAIEPDFVEKGWVLEYAGFGMPEIAVSLTPGSVPESLFWMPHLIEQGFFVRGFGGAENFGIDLLTKYRDYYNLQYPFLLGKEWLDRDRAWMFVSEFEQRLAEDTMPSFSWIFLPNNHAFGLSPGEWTPASWVADNDEGVGIVVHAIANSPIWEQSLILVFEDDAQSGFDHIDQHRCPALAISPWVKRAHVSSVAYSMPNMHKTMELVLGSTPMTRFDDLSTGFYDIFIARPDLAPYQRVPRQYPEEVYEEPDEDLVEMSRNMDWDDIDKNQWEAAELYWRHQKGTDPPQ